MRLCHKISLKGKHSQVPGKAILANLRGDQNFLGIPLKPVKF